ncbi:hypothetical protein CMK18_21105 [Candidatus Poribacteria bacterium]|nr:hypothetical protein [Candidatus Poribacteria bacterium]
MGKLDQFSQYYFYIICNEFEGFTGILLKEMAHGLAVVNVDFDASPRDIIRHNLDEYSVAEHNFFCTRKRSVFTYDESKSSKSIN